MDFVQFTEITMLILFGLSWPFNIHRSWTSRTVKGKSLLFEVFVVCGYGVGVAGKFVTYRRTGAWTYAIWFYLADIMMVMIDLFLCMRNRRLDREREEND